jgi:hypothetical protein
MHFQQTFRHPGNKTVVTLQWNAPTDPVVVYVDEMMLPAIAMSRLEGDGYQLPSPRGPVHVRVDRSTPEIRFVVKLTGQELASSPVFSGQHLTGRSSTKKSGSVVPVLAAVFGGFLLLIVVGIVGSVVVLKSQIGTTLNRVSTTIGDAPFDPTLPGTITVPGDPLDPSAPSFSSTPPSI